MPPPAISAGPAAPASAPSAAPAPEGNPERRAQTAPRSADACAAKTLSALRARNPRQLADLVHPTQGVRFTPFAFPDAKADVVLRAGEIRHGFSDPAVRSWGMLGESDEPIQMTFAQYFARFVYDVPYASHRPAEAGTSDPFEAASFNLDTLRRDIGDAYPRGSVFEYRHPPADPRNGQQYRILRLVCEEHGGGHYLVGVIHSEWTP